MPFLRAGFNGRNRDTGIRGWTRPLAGGKFALAELRLMHAGDLLWVGAGKHAFVAWGEACVFGSFGFDDLAGAWDDDLPQSKIPDGPRRAERIEFTILGEPASKANSRKLVSMNRLSTKTGRMVKMPAIIKSEKARDYERDALLQIPPPARCRLEGPVRVTLRIFYATERPDLDESVVLDVMQDRYHGSGEQRVLVQRGVFRNDRQVREKHVFHGIDRANPRAEVIVEPMEPAPGDLLDIQAEQEEEVAA